MTLVERKLKADAGNKKWVRRCQPSPTANKITKIMDLNLSISDEYDASKKCV